MVWVVAAIVFINALSIVAGALIVLVFRSVRRRQAAFLRELFNNDSDVEDAQFSVFPVLLWVYILGTVAVTILSILLFLFQPHWL